MKKGTKVSWLAEGATIRGHGTTISDEENGHVLVAVDGGLSYGHLLHGDMANSRKFTLISNS